jgi:DNA repair exonuclease SbcCD nuclease subunit
VKILVTGDWHLDARTAGFDRFEDLRGAVDWTVALAATVGVDLYVNLGDLCDPDSTRSHRAIGLACETAAKLADLGIAQVWLSGNHDVIEDGTGATTLAALAGWASSSRFAPVLRRTYRDDCVFVVAQEPRHIVRFGDGQIDLLLLPFTPRAKAYDPATFVERIKLSDGCRKLLVFGHLNVIGAEDGSEVEDFPRGREVVFPTDALLARFGDRCMLFNGHYHRRQTVRGVRMPGALGRLGFGEVGNPAGVLLVEVSDA